MEENFLRKKYSYNKRNVLTREKFFDKKKSLNERKDCASEKKKHFSVRKSLSTRGNSLKWRTVFFKTFFSKVKVILSKVTKV